MIAVWLLKNVGLEQPKPLKMQKMLIIEVLAMRRYMQNKFNQGDGSEKKDIVMNEERMLAMNFRLI